jgi:hypothetical protein
VSIRRKNGINGQWSPRLIEMLESPAYRALSLSAHLVISRIEIELAHHAGNDNGRLPVTKLDFVDYGISHDAVAPAIRVAEALGFIRITVRGHGGNAEHRRPNLFWLTFAHSRNSRSGPPTHDWRKIKTTEDAEAIARAARANKSQAAVSLGQRSATKNRNRSWKPGPVPVLETRTEMSNFPVLETRTTGSGQKPGPLSISRGKAALGRASSGGPAQATQQYAGQGGGRYVLSDDPRAYQQYATTTPSSLRFVVEETVTTVARED